MLKFRLAEHRGYVSNKQTNEATGQHSNLPGHSIADLQITAIEQVKKNDVIYRRQREEYHIRGFTRLQTKDYRKSERGQALVYVN